MEFCTHFALSDPNILQRHSESFKISILISDENPELKQEMGTIEGTSK